MADDADQERSRRLARFRPASGMDTPRFSGPASFMRLPALDPAEYAAREDIGVEIGLIGIPFDGATTNRPGSGRGWRGRRDRAGRRHLVSACDGHPPADFLRRDHAQT